MVHTADEGGLDNQKSQTMAQSEFDSGMSR